MGNFNAKIVAEIIRQSPRKTNPVNYLMKMFPMSKETAYRRIRNDIPFPLDETVAIAQDLNVSIDQLIDAKTGNNYPFIRGLDIENEPIDIYSSLIREDIEVMRRLAAAKSMNVIATMNRIPLRLLPYKALLRFDYCNYLYSIGKISLMTHCPDIVVPPEIIDLHRESVSRISQLNNITCIIDDMFFPDIIKRLQYHYRLGFISAAEIKVLQAELFELLGAYENMLRSGKSASGREYVFYYSLSNLESSSIFLEYDRSSILQIWLYPESPVVIKDNQPVSAIHKKWIESKMRNSVLITKINDSQKIEMLRNAYRGIEELKIKN